MSRRRGEFEHRTSIFEGAFRAWSHLGGMDPLDLENKPASELDPLTNPIEDDERLRKGSKPDKNPDGSHRREYPYEPLPRSGLSHPYVQAVLSPWLGPDADNEAIQLGLTTLRTWWQHRRKGESRSAMAALGTEKMKGVVEGYTRHFFTLSHCLIVNDKEQPPRSLASRMKELEKLRKKGIKKRAPRAAGDDVNGSGATSLGSNLLGNSLTGSVGSAGGGGGAAGGGSGVDQTLAASLNQDLTDDTLSPLERLHAAQRRQLEEAGGIMGSGGEGMMTTPIINIKGKCIPGKLDLPGVVDAVNQKAMQLSHRGGHVPDGVGGDHPGAVSSMPMDGHSNQHYGDPDTAPVVYVSPATGDVQIAMTVDGITCAHCVKIVETVLKGCNGNKSPIDGVLDAAADRDMCSVLIKIDRAPTAKRIAFEAARNLAMVGYTAKAKTMPLGGHQGKTMDFFSLSRAFEIVATTQAPSGTGDDGGNAAAPALLFDWTIACTCPDNGVLREDCTRHSQMGNRVFDSFDTRKEQVSEYVAGHGVNPGEQQEDQFPGPDDPSAALMPSPLDNPFGNPLDVDDQQMEDFSFGMEPPSVPGPPRPVAPAPAPHQHPPSSISYGTSQNGPSSQEVGGIGGIGGGGFASGSGGGSHGPARSSMRNPSILSYGNGLRNMSMSSEATFGRAMSGLSALSIDWENLEDFDLEVDHSAHINAPGGGGGGSGGGGGGGGAAVLNSPKPGSVDIVGGARRSSLRRSFMSTSNDKDRDAHVSFKV